VAAATPVESDMLRIYFGVYERRWSSQKFIDFGRGVVAEQMNVDDAGESAELFFFVLFVVVLDPKGD
jgi:hypothetical protein